VLDEPTSALDVSMRVQIVNLLADVQEEFGLTYLLIAHDFALVGNFCTTVAAMYLGRIVEAGAVDQVFSHLRRPYTEALPSSVLHPDPDRGLARSDVTGEIGSAITPASGCRFHPRRPYAFAPCMSVVPTTRSLGGHRWDCHLRAAPA
jgi:peptide/nickel transport system ATP-binding protein